MKTLRQVQGLGGTGHQSLDILIPNLLLLLFWIFLRFCLIIEKLLFSESAKSARYGRVVRSRKRAHGPRQFHRRVKMLPRNDGQVGRYSLRALS